MVRSWLELTDNPDSYMILREDKDDPATDKPQQRYTCTALAGAWVKRAGVPRQSEWR